MTDVERWLVVGPGGAGKSTLSRRLAEVTELPLVHLDRLYWGRDWTPREDWPERLEDALAGARWIIDGNYSSTVARRLERAQAVIVLAPPRVVCVAGLVRRWLRARWGEERRDLPEGCDEQLSPEFVSYVWKWPGESRRRMEERLAAFDGPVHWFGSRRNAWRFVERPGVPPPLTPPPRPPKL